VPRKPLLSWVYEGDSYSHSQISSQDLKGSEGALFIPPLNIRGDTEKPVANQVEETTLDSNIRPSPSPYLPEKQRSKFSIAKQEIMSSLKLRRW
jgi:hypothetical protein